MSVVQPFLDPGLQHAFEGVCTQHVFRFQKVAISERFKLGPRCTNKASSGEPFYEFVDDNANSVIGKSPRKIVVQWNPEDGERMMNRVPTNLLVIKPQRFVEGTASYIREIVQRIIACYSRNIFIEKDRNEFLKRLPLADASAEEFAYRNNELHIPFRNFLEMAADPGKLIDGALRIRHRKILCSLVASQR